MVLITAEQLETFTLLPYFVQEVCSANISTVWRVVTVNLLIMALWGKNEKWGKCEQKVRWGKYETTMQGHSSKHTFRWSNKDHKIAKIGLSGPILKGI